ncbi:MAG TPA: DUF4230 domain-containing protein [Patescibacteria group bacterium]|nr:DUF4230 domain-containing protein [Patescibacteria group bacterium]
MRKLKLALIFGTLFFAVGFFVSLFLFRDSEGGKVSSQTILTALRERGFLVTQTYVANESVKIENDSEDFWRKLLWGQAIKAYGVVEVNLGVDLSKLEESDIKISKDKITVAIPKVNVFNSRLVGDVSLENKQGLLKRIFENDDGYNQAVSALVNQAEQNILTAEVLTTANDKAVEEIKRLVGYFVEDREVEVVIK